MKLLKPLIVAIAVTNQCNLRCIHCFPDSRLKLQNELTNGEIKDIIRQSASMGVFVIAFTGGEVFTKVGILDIMKFTHSLGIKISITTNATLITKSLVRELSRLDIRLIRISLDAPIASKHDEFRGQSGAFNLSVQAIKMLSEYGIPVQIQTTLSHFNLEDIPALIDLAVELRAKSFNTSILTPYGRAKALENLRLSPEELRSFYLEQEKRREHYQGIIDIKTNHPLTHLLFKPNTQIRLPARTCPAGITSMEISSDGYVCPCLCIPIQEDNIRDRSLEEIWYKSELFNSIRNPHLKQGKCSICEHLLSCGGGCHAAAYVATGSIHNPDPNCWYHPDDMQKN